MSFSNQQPPALSEYSPLCNARNPDCFPASESPRDFAKAEFEWQRTEGKLNEIGLNVNAGGQIKDGLSKNIGFTDEDKLCFFETKLDKSLQLGPKEKIDCEWQNKGNQILAGADQLGGVSFLTEPFLSPKPAEVPLASAGQSDGFEQIKAITDQEKAAQKTNFESIIQPEDTLIGLATNDYDQKPFSNQNRSIWHENVNTLISDDPSKNLFSGSMMKNQVQSTCPPQMSDTKSQPPTTLVELAQEDANPDPANKVCDLDENGAALDVDDCVDSLEDCLLLDRTSYQRKAMRRAMSECSHLAVPPPVNIADKYPEIQGAKENLNKVSSLGGLNYTPSSVPKKPVNSMKRSMTVAEEQTTGYDFNARREIIGQCASPTKGDMDDAKDGSSSTNQELLILGRHLTKLDETVEPSAGDVTNELKWESIPPCNAPECKKVEEKNRGDTEKEEGPGPIHLSPPCEQPFTQHLGGKEAAPDLSLGGKEAAPDLSLGGKEAAPEQSLGGSGLPPPVSPVNHKTAYGIKDNVATMVSSETLNPPLQDINYPLLSKETSLGDQVDNRLIKPKPFQTEHQKPETSVDSIFGSTDVTKCPYFSPEFAVTKPAREHAQKDKANRGERKVGYHYEQPMLMEEDYWPGEKLDVAFPVLEDERPFLASGTKWDKPKKRDKWGGERSFVGHSADTKQQQMEYGVFDSKPQYKNIPVDVLFDQEAFLWNEQTRPVAVLGEETPFTKQKSSNRRPKHKKEQSNKSFDNLEPLSGKSQHLLNKSLDSGLLGSEEKVEYMKTNQKLPLVPNIADTPVVNKSEAKVVHVPNFGLDEASQAITVTLESPINLVDNQKSLGVSTEIKEPILALALGTAKPDLGQTSPENKSKTDAVKEIFPEASADLEIMPRDQPVSSSRKGPSDGNVPYDRQTKSKRGKGKGKTYTAAFLEADLSNKGVVGQSLPSSSYTEPNDKPKEPVTTKKAERGSLKRPHTSEQKDVQVLPNNSYILTNVEVAPKSYVAPELLLLDKTVEEPQAPLLEKESSSLPVFSDGSQNLNLEQIQIKSQDLDLLDQVTDMLTLTSDVSEEKAKFKPEITEPLNIALDSKVDTLAHLLVQELPKLDTPREEPKDGRESRVEPTSQSSAKALTEHKTEIHKAAKDDKMPDVNPASSVHELSKVVTLTSEIDKDVTETKGDPVSHSSVKDLSKGADLSIKQSRDDESLGVCPVPQSSDETLSKDKTPTFAKELNLASEFDLSYQTQGPFGKIKDFCTEFAEANNLLEKPQPNRQCEETPCTVKAAAGFLDGNGNVAEAAQPSPSLLDSSSCDTVKVAVCATSEVPLQKSASNRLEKSKQVDSDIPQTDNNQAVPSKTELRDEMQTPAEVPKVQITPLPASWENTIQAKVSLPALKHGETTDSAQIKTKAVPPPKKGPPSQKVPHKIAKTEEKAKAPEVIKGYMRPTKSRGVTSAPRAASTEVEKSKPSKDTRINQQRPDKEKPAESVVPRAGSDITAPPNKQLPASPEKKVKATTATPSKTTAATPKGKLSAAPSPKKPLSATPTQAKKLSSPAAAPTAASTTKRPLGSATKTATPKEAKDVKPKSLDLKSPVKTPEKKAPTPLSTTPRPAVRASPAAPKLGSSAAGGTAPKPNLTPKRPSSIKNDVKPIDARKPNLTKSPTESGGPKADLAKTNGTAPASNVPSRPKTTKPAAPRPLTGPSASADAKKVPTTRPPPLSKPSSAPASKPSTAPKQPRPTTAPDIKNIRSKIGSTDNLKHQPGGGKQAKVEKKPVPASTARKPVPLAAPKPAASKPADSKEAVQKQSNGKVQIVSKKANYSHVQSKCGSKDNIKHVPGGGNVTNSTKPSVGAARPPTSTGQKPGSTNVQITNKKIDVSKVSAKCGSKPITKHKTGGADSKSEENSKKSEVTKPQPQDSTKENEVEQAAPSQNGDLVTPTEVTAADTRENGVEETLPVDGGNQREIQSFNALIPETSI
ncbi:uncharacterized protein [Pyxicephalus adspersus]|uniref:uncharacterized protein n=1 Tax=Pyxicephalus adspersus TaxID=30357 RepID=UPI003B5A21F0